MRKGGVIDHGVSLRRIMEKLGEASSTYPKSSNLDNQHRFPRVLPELLYMEVSSLQPAGIAFVLQITSAPHNAIGRAAGLESAWQELVGKMYLNSAHFQCRRGLGTPSPSGRINGS